MCWTIRILKSRNKARNHCHLLFLISFINLPFASQDTILVAIVVFFQSRTAQSSRLWFDFYIRNNYWNAMADGPLLFLNFFFDGPILISSLDLGTQRNKRHLRIWWRCGCSYLTFHFAHLIHHHHPRDFRFCISAFPSSNTESEDN